MEPASPPRPAFTVVRDERGEASIDVHLGGEALLRWPLTNKGTAFTAEERVALRLVGLLPPRIETLAEQTSRALAAFTREPTALGRYRLLRRLQDTNEVLFYALLREHLREMLPIVYTPTVGEAVLHFSSIYEEPRGLTISHDDPTPPRDVVARYPQDDVRMIVATDASAILGIGDQGYNGLAISIGKLSIYTVGGGVSPFQTLPVVLDMGTDQERLAADPMYLGVRRKRARGEPHLALVRSFVDAVRERWPRAIIQWEDFGKETAFDVLDAFRDVVPSFNDDIQGTGAVALAGLIAATRGRGGGLKDERFLVFGAGAGGAGVARAIRGGLEREGLTRAEAAARVFVVDSKGLLVEGRAMEPYKRELAQPARSVAGWGKDGRPPTLLEAIAGARVTALLGLSGQPGAFDERVIRAVAANTSRPIVFALSNPTSACEAVPADVLRWTDGEAIVATGSPFDPVTVDGEPRVVGQGNNAFIFPGLGLGALMTEARRITDAMVVEAADALAELTLERYGAEGLVYPPVEALGDVSVRVAARVAKRALEEGVAERTTLPADLDALERHARIVAWSPRYLPFRPAR
jgi:malate dehydrogenase (oxaloacetate-decarboxylating)